MAAFLLVSTKLLIYFRESKLIKDMNSTLTIGDTVVLKSGSSLMTINSIQGDEALCIWSKNGEIQQHWFNLKTLEKREQTTEEALFG